MPADTASAIIFAIIELATLLRHAAAADIVFAITPSRYAFAMPFRFRAPT
jgi:hypothetical protein